MNTIIAPATQHSRSLRQTLDRAISRLTRRARLRIAVTLKVPPFIAVAVHYEANLAEPANDNRRRSATDS